MTSVTLPKWSRPIALAAVAVALCATGCAKTGKVTGIVSFEGKPLPGGRITFTPAGGGKAGVAELDADGKYTVDAPVGECKISLDTSYLMGMEQQQGPIVGGPAARAPGGKNPMEGMPQDKKDMMDKADELNKGNKKAYMEIPPVYANPEKSGLSYTVEKGSHDHPIDLKRPDGWKSSKEYGKGGPPKPGEGQGGGPPMPK